MLLKNIKAKTTDHTFGLLTGSARIPENTWLIAKQVVNHQQNPV